MRCRLCAHNFQAVLPLNPALARYFKIYVYEQSVHLERRLKCLHGTDGTCQRCHWAAAACCHCYLTFVLPLVNYYLSSIDCLTRRLSARHRVASGPASDCTGATHSADRVQNSKRTSGYSGRMSAVMASAAFLRAPAAAAATRRHRRQPVVAAGQGFASNKPAKAPSSSKKVSGCAERLWLIPLPGLPAAAAAMPWSPHGSATRQCCSYALPPSSSAQPGYAGMTNSHMQQPKLARYLEKDGTPAQQGAAAAAPADGWVRPVCSGERRRSPRNGSNPAEAHGMQPLLRCRTLGQLHRISPPPVHRTSATPSLGPVPPVCPRAGGNAGCGC